MSPTGCSRKTALTESTQQGLLGALILAPELCRPSMSSESTVVGECGHVSSGRDRHKANQSIFGD